MVTPSKVTKKRAPKSTPSRTPAKKTPSKSSSSTARGANDDADKHFLWLCFLHNGGKPTPDYHEICTELGINYKTAAGRFYKLRNHFEKTGKSSDTPKKEEQGDSDTAMKTESNIKAEDFEAKEDFSNDV
ncbi:hypothetical protein N7509_006127 [Penicillium cosmopolitanum]|uniref:Myb-like DNA-binding domain-containing protein n=1 Tax=Penicillium cosmopolitanum TaxID=1131564 RepID=A0A9X0BAS6_9EURO|nr:uncharacterized protein N7509_006127 [Penicillium cosmopolitanum]KAJ5398014.1 hypothetical protein N7509_006127 [Penicillium cosmopolitanum]